VSDTYREIKRCGRTLPELKIPEKYKMAVKVKGQGQISPPLFYVQNQVRHIIT